MRMVLPEKKLFIALSNLSTLFVKRLQITSALSHSGDQLITESDLINQGKMSLVIGSQYLNMVSPS